jgi:signal transduction histidine kinase
MKKVAGGRWFVSIPLLILTLVISVPVRAQSIDISTPEPVVLTDGQGEYPLGLHLEILEDPGGELTIQQVSSPAYDSQFIPSQSRVPNYGYTSSVYWVRFHLKNTTSHLSRWLLVDGFANSQYVDLYLPNPVGTGWVAKQSGNLRPFSTRDAPTHHIAFAIPLPPHEEQTYYVRFQSEASMTLPLVLWQPESFLQDLAFELLGLGLFYGALLIMLVYHLFVLYWLKEASYVYFVCFLGTIILWLLSYDGLAGQYLWPNAAIINRYTPLIFSLTATILIILFVDAFLEMKKRHPRFHTLLLALAAGLGIVLLLVPFASYHFMVTWFVPYVLISLLAAVSAGLISWRSGYQPARFFLFSWLGLLAGIIFTFLIREGLAPSTNLNENFIRMGSLWMAAFWSISLADRVNMLKAETENANQALRSSEHKLSQILEGLPLAVVMYGKDRKPHYGNKRTYELLTNPLRNIRPDLSAGRTLETAINYYSLKQEGTDLPYPVEKFPVHNALLGEPAYADDIEVDTGERRIPLEIWASPMKDEAGSVESAVVAFQDVSQRKQEESELIGYRNQLEALVDKRTNELNKTNEKLKLRLEWLSAVNKVHQSISGLESLEIGYQELSHKILQIFQAKLVFIMRWDSEDAHAEALACSLEMGKPHDKKPLKDLFLEDSLLRREIEKGHLITYTPEQTGSFSTSFSECFPDQDVPSLILAPIMIGPSVMGTLGVAITTPSQDLLAAESDLVERMALDLASLAQGALLLDQAVVLATVEERNRLARELHDSVTQTLFTASVLAEATPHILEKDQGLGRQNLTKLSRLIRGALAEMRSMLIELRMGDLHRQTLEQLLATLVDGARARSQAVFTLSMMKDVPELPEKVTMAFYRMAREALINSIVHAGAAHIQVTLFEEDEQLVLCVEDDGCGFDLQAVPAGHLGLNIMGERAHEIGATLKVDTGPGRGTTIRIAWPVGGEKKRNND